MIQRSQTVPLLDIDYETELISKLDFALLKRKAQLHAAAREAMKKDANLSRLKGEINPDQNSWRTGLGSGIS